MSASTTQAKLLEFAEKSKNLLLERNEDFAKFQRTFNSTEAKEYLKADYRTIVKQLEVLGIDPTRFKDDGYDWILTLEEIYMVRKNLPQSTTLKRKYKKFVRSERQKSQRIIIQNQKGGVGKTLTAITLATGFAINYHEEYRILLVDMDGQSTLSSYFPSDENRVTVGDLIKIDPSTANYDELIKASISSTTIPNLKIITADQVDRDIETVFHQGFKNGEIKQPELRLDKVLSALENDFDIIIIDTPPSLGYASTNAYFAGTSVIFPLGANHNDLDATLQYLRFLPAIYADFARMGHKGYDFMKFLLTNYEANASSQIEITSTLLCNFSDSILSTQFKKSEAIRRCSLNKKSVFELSNSEYDEHKQTFKKAVSETKPVIEALMFEIQNVWKKQNAN